MARVILTDLNDRERERYGATLDKLGELSGSLAKALRSGDDIQAALLLALVDCLGSAVVEGLLPVFKAALAVEVPESPEGL